VNQPNSNDTAHAAEQTGKRRHRFLRRLGVVLLLLVALLGMAWWTFIWMPGDSHRGELPALDDDSQALATRLRQHVEKLAGEIGPRNLEHYTELGRAAGYIEQQLEDAGLAVSRHSFEAESRPYDNLVAEIPGATAPKEIVVIGAHYDSFFDAPGANDNASGVAALIELARRFAAAEKPNRTLRFVAFANEEPPYFQREGMGSWAYAKLCRERGDDITAMLSIETIGYYSDEPGSQEYPPGISLLYPSRGNFVGFVGNVKSRRLVRRMIEQFRGSAEFPSEGAALPGFIKGIGWSDHWAFWKEGYAGAMATDTAIFRYPHYHKASDTPDKLDYERMARVAAGLEAVIRDLAGS